MQLERNRPTIWLCVLLAIFCVVHASVFIFQANRPQAHLTVDSADYVQAARNLLDHGVLYSERLDKPIAPEHYAKRTPAYPVALAALWLLGDPLMPAILCQIALNLAGAALLWRLARDFGLASGYRLLLVGLLLFYPAQIVYAHTIMAEVMFETLVLVAFVLVAWHLRSRSEALLALANVALGLAILTKPALVYFWIPNLVFHGWLAIRFRRARLAAWALVPVLLIGAWSYRNFERTGYFHFSSMRQVSLKQRMIWRPGFREEWEAREKAGKTVLSESQLLERAYIADRLKNWPDAAWLHAFGMASFFLDPGRFDVYQILGKPQQVELRRAIASDKRSAWDAIRRIPVPIAVFLVSMLLVNLFVLAAFAFWLFASRLPLELRIFAAALTGYLALITGTIGASRYRLGVEPILLFAVPFFVRWLRERKPRRPALVANESHEDSLAT